MTHTAFIRQQIEHTAKQVCARLAITRSRYDSYLHDAATDWLLHHLDYDTLVVDDVMQTKVFWQWWYLHAYHRDRGWLQITYTGTTEVYRLLNDWLYYHSSHRLCDTTIKHGRILYDSYANINWTLNI